MPVLPTYPGIYIEDVVSPSRAVDGVPSSITAFIGQALRGPVNEPVRISEFADFERIFGGLWSETALGYSVQQFFLNGGTDAIIIRVLTDSLVKPAAKAKYNFPAVDLGNPLKLQAVNEGEWGNNIFVAISLNADDSFNLHIQEHAGPLRTDQILREEVFYNLSVSVSSPRFVGGVLEHESDLIRAVSPWPTSFPAMTVDPDTLDPAALPLLGGANGDYITNANVLGSQSQKTGLYALEKADLFNILCIPPLRRASAGVTAVEVEVSTWSTALAYCKQRRAILIVDPLESWTTASQAIGDLNNSYAGLRSPNSVIYFPRIVAPDALAAGELATFAPSGSVAGVMARIDATRGVWKAPAGTDSKLEGVADLSVNLTDVDSGRLNPMAINAIRQMPASGIVVWGARTLDGVEQLASEWKFLNVRRLALYIEESLRRGLEWAVFEPNDESLWAQIRLSVDGFMHSLHRRRAFASSSPAAAYFVACDATTTPQEDIDRGVVNVVVGFAPTVPAEFVVITIQQSTRESEA